MFSLYITDLVLTDDELKNLTLVEIEKWLRRRNKSLKKIETMPQVNLPLNPESYNQLIADELNYDHRELILEHKKLTSTMTERTKEHIRHNHEFRGCEQRWFFLHLWVWWNW